MLRIKKLDRARYQAHAPEPASEDYCSVALWVTCTGAGADSSLTGLPSPGGSAGESFLEGSSSEDASGASSVAVGGTWEDGRSLGDIASPIARADSPSWARCHP